MLDSYDFSIEEKFMVNGKEVILSNKFLEVRPDQIDEYLKKEAAIYAYYAAIMCNIEQEVLDADAEYDKCYAEAFKEGKESKKRISDNTAKSFATSDPEVVAALERKNDAKRKTKMLYYFLKAIDKAHENVLNMAYNVRREMKLIGESTVSDSPFVRPPIPE